MALGIGGLWAATGVGATTTFTVNSTGDQPDANPGDGVCATAVSTCTLRAAIQEANADPGVQTIAFDVPGSSPQTIVIASSLPPITSPVIIDGSTQPSGPAEVYGNSNRNVEGFDVAPGGGGSTIRALRLEGLDDAIRLEAGADANLVSANQIGTDDVGIHIESNGNRLLGNWVGTIDGVDPASTNIDVFVGPGNGVSPAVDDNVIGGTAAGSANVISGGSTFGFSGGVEMEGAGTGNVVEGNLIGTTSNGLNPLPNANSGVRLSGKLTGNRIGPGNVISGNTAAGVEIDGSAATGNTLEGNLIGTDPSGQFTLPNGGDGVFINGAPGNVVGGAAPPPNTDRSLLSSGSQGNVISGNSARGVELSGAGASGDVVEGNYVGTDSSGSNPLGNHDTGLLIGAGALNNVIGGGAAGAGNVISGNSSDGVTLTDNGTSGNELLGNRIGTNAAGTAALANVGDGIFDTVAGDVIGASGAGNVISGNVSNGIFVSSSGGSTTIHANLIGTNAAGTAALANGEIGILVNDAAVNKIGGTAAGDGNVISGNAKQGVELAESSSGDAHGNVLEANRIGTNAGGSAALPNGSDGVAISGAPGTQIGSTSSAGRNVISGNTGDGINVSGTTATTTLVEGNFIGTDATGATKLGNNLFGIEVGGGAPPATIGGPTGTTPSGACTGACNLVSGNFNGVELDPGTSGSVIQGNHIGTNAAGTAALGNKIEGIKVDHATAAMIGGTSAAAGNLISGNADGVRISGDGPTTPMKNQVLGNKIGTDPTGTTAIGNTNAGIFLDNGPGNMLGAPGAGNLVAGNGGYGIQLLDTDSTGNLIQANHIGTNQTGTGAIANGLDGIVIDDAPNNTVGPAAGASSTGTANLISGNDGDGVHLMRAATGNLIDGNLIGTQAGGTAALPNKGNGVHIVASSNTIGSSAANTIAFNALRGVFIENGASTTSAQDRVSANSIFSNGALGIDLAPIGVNPNNPSSPGTGPNLDQNYPVLTSVSRPTSTSITIHGTLNSVKNTTYRVEFFDTPRCDPSGFGQGKRFLGAANTTTNASGNASFSTTLAQTVPLGDAITTTATDPNGNTSEFSRCAPPTISSLAPSNGPTGTTVTINGTSLTGATAVKFNGLGASFQVVSDTAITATIPNGATSGKVSVITHSGTATSASSFTVTFSVTSFSPSSGAAGTTVTLHGAGFNHSSVAKFNGAMATSTTFVSSTQLTAVAPAAATTGKITITNTTAPVGTVSSASTFTKL